MPFIRIALELVFIPPPRCANMYHVAVVYTSGRYILIVCSFRVATASRAPFTGGLCVVTFLS